MYMYMHSNIKNYGAKTITKIVIFNSQCFHTKRIYMNSSRSGVKYLHHFPLFHIGRMPSINLDFLQSKKDISIFQCVWVFFFGCLLSLVDHYLIKTLFILKIKTVNSKDKVYKNYNPYQIRPDTVDLVADYWIFHHFFCCIIITRSTAILTRIAVFF